MGNRQPPRAFVEFNEQRQTQRREHEILEARKKLNEAWYVRPECRNPHVSYPEWEQLYLHNLVRFFGKTTLTAELNLRNNLHDITLLFEAGYWPYNAALEIMQRHDKTFKTNG